MTTTETAVDVVTLLWAACGRRPEEATFAAWSTALGPLTDDALVMEAAVQVIRNVDMSFGPPGPAVVIEAYQVILRRLQPLVPQLEEENNPVVAGDEARRRGLEASIEQLRQSQQMPGRERAAMATPRLDFPRRANAHDFNDHALCLPTDPCRSAPLEAEAEPDDPEDTLP